MICKICGQEVQNKGITSHLRKHKLSDKEYYDTYIKTESDIDLFITNFTNQN